MCPIRNLPRFIKYYRSGDAVIPTNKSSFERILHHDEEDRVIGTANTPKLIVSRNIDSTYAPNMSSFSNTDETGIRNYHKFFCDYYFT